MATITQKRAEALRLLALLSNGNLSESQEAYARGASAAITWDLDTQGAHPPSTSLEPQTELKVEIPLRHPEDR